MCYFACFFVVFFCFSVNDQTDGGVRFLQGAASWRSSNVRSSPCTQRYDLEQARGWSGGAQVLGKLSAPGRPTYLDDSRARAYYVCNRCGWGVFGHFLRSSIISLLFL